MKKRAKIVKSKKGRTIKIYAIKIERKRLLKQRRENVLQNAKDRKLAKANPLVALQASIRANSASNDTQSITNTDDEVIADVNTDVIISTENTDNVAIDAENTDNAAIDAENTDNAATDGEEIDDATMSDNDTVNPATGDGNICRVHWDGGNSQGSTRHSL